MAETAYEPNPKGLFSYLGLGDTEAGSNALGYPAGTKIYRALLTQTGTNAPVATVLTNTLGFDLIWSRLNQGIYLGQSNTVPNEFPVGRTLVFCGEGQTTAITWTAAGVLAAAKIFQDDAIQINTGASGSPADDLLFETPIEIIIYPE